MTPSDYRKEFPEREPIELEIPAGFVDQSWRNDLCPSFVNLELGLCLWIEEKDPERREMPGMDRFALEVIKPTDDGYFENTQTLYAISDDWQFILAEIERAKGLP